MNLSGDILIVDDFADNLQLLSDMLQNEGHQVTMAENGVSALLFIAESQPDIILLDVQMPGLDGYEVCKRLKADALTEHIPVLFLSAFHETEHILKGFAVGGVDYIGKPFKSQEVVARVHNHLMLAHQRKTLMAQRDEIEKLRAHEQQQYEVLSAMKDNFINQAAHDLKNPLMSINLMCQQLETMAAQLPEFELNDIVRDLRYSAHTMEQLVSDVLDLARLQARKQIELAEVDLRDALDACVTRLAGQAAYRGISLHLDVPDTPVIVAVDYNAFMRVLDNLVINALKYSKGGQRVKLGLTCDDAGIHISVQDHGIGIPKADLPHIFTSFYRVKSAEHQAVAGSGLGLAIVKAIVDQHGAQIDVKSALGKGATFTVTLPIDA